jgi:hypothetical protein
MLVGVKRLAVGALVAATLAGCGTQAGERPRSQLILCRPGDREYRLCGYPTDRRKASAIYAGVSGRRLVGPLEGGAKRPRGYWRSVRVSPDGTTLLVTWSGECEIPTAFFVGASGGQPHAVTGEDDWRRAPESLGLDWTRQGLARVRFPRAACGHGVHRPGVYLIDPVTGAIRGPVG